MDNDEKSSKSKPLTETKHVDSCPESSGAANSPGNIHQEKQSTQNALKDFGRVYFGVAYCVSASFVGSAISETFGMKNRKDLEKD